jgi:hypothetical protein
MEGQAQARARTVCEARCYSACGGLLWRGDNGSEQGTYTRSEGGTDAEAPRNGTQGSGNPQASGDRRQGCSHT